MSDIFIVCLFGMDVCVCVGKLWQLLAIMTDLHAARQRAVILSQTSRMLHLLESFMDSRHIRYLRIGSHHSVCDVTCHVSVDKCLLVVSCLRHRLLQVCL